VKLEIVLNIPPIDVMGKLDVTPMDHHRDVYIDDKLVPKTLRDIILLGLDVATTDYIKTIENLRNGI
jgi:hypothetical protein